MARLSDDTCLDCQLVAPAYRLFTSLRKGHTLVAWGVVVDSVRSRPGLQAGANPA
jgi:hypothetical protein